MNKNFTLFSIKNLGFLLVLFAIVGIFTNWQKGRNYKNPNIHESKTILDDFNSSPNNFNLALLQSNEGKTQNKLSKGNFENIISEKISEIKEKIELSDIHSAKSVNDNNEIGEIGNRDPKEDDLDGSDNVFKVNLQSFDINKKYILTYDIDGYSDAASIAKSVNGNYSFGGYAKTVHKGWTKITEVLNSNSLQLGNNYILFNTVDKGDFYTVKNVKVQEVNSKSDSSNFEITAEKFNDDVLYFKGFVKLGSGIKYLLVQNKKIELLGNEFEFFSKENNLQNIKIKFVSENGSYIEKTISKNNLSSEVNLSTYNEAQKNIVEKYDFGYILGLRTVDLPPVDQSISNVSYQYAGFKYSSTSEKEGGHIKIPYDLNKIPKGYKEKDISTFTFDYTTKKWRKIVVDSINFQKKYIVIKANVGESTNFINGVARQPESPENGAFAPTTLNNDPIANPASKINMIAPPTANQQGSANLQYPIEIPVGINGFQPSISVNYNSDNKSGWLGVGWDIATETIDIDTRWGTPEFNPTNESEIYILAGEQLVFDDAFSPNKNPIKQVRGTGQKRFYFRNGLKETSIIIRKGSTPKDYSWEILDGSGTKKIYSGLLKDVAGNIVKWYLTSVVDKYGNTIVYNYANTSDGGGTNIYLSKITYSNNTVVTFINQTSIRGDLTSSYKLGVKITNSRLLDKITVSRANIKIREYQFLYNTGTFSKSLLTDLIQKDGKNNEFNRHKFKYSGTTTSPLFNDNSLTVSIPNDNLKSGNFLGSNFSVLGGQQTKSTNFIRGAVTVGFSRSFLSWFFPVSIEFTKKGTAGINGSYTESETFGKTQLMDIDGDGLPDKVFYTGSGNIQYRKNLGLSFSNVAYSVTGINNKQALSRTNSYITSFGVEASFKNGIGAGATYSTTKANTPVYFSDVNGDGLPDLVNYGEVFFNKLSKVNNQFLPVFISTDTSQTPNVLMEGIPAVQTTTPAESYSLFSNVVRMWEAPVTGDISIVNTISLEQNSKDGVDVWIEKGAKTRANEDNNAASTLILSKVTLNTQGQTKSLNSTTHVEKGQRIFIVANNKSDVDGDKVKINSQINYTGGISGFSNLDLKDANNNYYFKSNFSDAYIPSDYRGNSIGGKSTIKVNWGTLSNQTFSEDLNFRIYKIEKKQSDTTALGGVPQLIYFKRLDRGTSLNTVTPASNSIAGIDISNILLNQNSTEADPVNSFLYFTVNADSNVAWEKIKWNSTIDITADGETRTVKPIVDYQLFSENVKYGTIPSEQNYILNYSVANELRTYPKFTSCFSAPLVLPQTISNVAGTEVTFIAKFINYHNNDTGTTVPVYELKKKVIVDSQRRMAIPYFDHFIPKNGASYTKVYYEIYSTNYDVANYLANKNPYIEQLDNSCDLQILSDKPSFYSYRSQHKNYNIQTGNNWQGWGGFAYNGSKYPNQTLKENEFFKDVTDADMPQDPPCSPTATDYETCMLNYVKGEQNKRYFTPLQCNPENNSYSSPVEMAYLDQNYLQPYALNAYKPSSTDFSDPKVVVSSPRGIIPHSSGYSLNLYGSFSFPLTPDLGAGVGVNGGYSKDKTSEFFIDVNGDQYPDVITGTQYQPTNQLGQLGSVLDSSDKTTQNSTINIGASTSVSSTKSGNTSATDFDTFGGLVSQIGTSANNVGASGSIGSANGNSKDVWLDINGDGLLDFVSNSTVYVNNGRTFIPDSNWNLGKVSSSDITTLSAGGGVNLWGGSWVTGVGLGTSTSNATLTFVDINGDGLVDKLVKKDDSYDVFYNKGNSFELAPVSLGTVDVKASITNQQVTSGYNFFGTICLTIFKIKTCISAGYSKDDITTKQTVDLRDFNGDGLPDIVFSTADDNLTYIENIGSQYNLLTSVENPLKGTIEIEYGNKNPISKTSIGSTYQMPFTKTVMTGIKINNKRVNDVIIHSSSQCDGECSRDNVYNILHYTFEYEKGIQDRREREFLGFGTIKTNLMGVGSDSLKVHQSQATEYETSFNADSDFYVPYDDTKVRQYFYKKGLVRSTSIINANAKVVAKTNYTYRYFDAIPATKFSLSETVPATVYKDLGRIIPLLYKTENIATEYSGTNSHSKTSLSTVDEYDKYGNVLKYTDRGTSLSDTSDDVVANIKYFAPDAMNIFGLPSEQTVTIGSTVVRKSTTEKNAKYDISRIKKYLGSEISQYDLSYDTYGNLIKSIQPKPKSSSAESERLFYNYEYDSTYHTYLLKISDAYGYSSSTLYDANYLLGVPIKSTDINNVSSYYTYDDFGRLIQYRSPVDTDWTIKLSYFPTATTPVAITERKAPIVNGVTPSLNYFSSVFTDGMGEEMDSKRLFQKNQGGSYSFVTNMVQLRDNLGRIDKNILWDEVTSSQDISAALKTHDQFFVSFKGNYGTYQSYNYDNNDRPIQVTQHNVQSDGQNKSLTTNINYGFDSDREGKIQFTQTTISPLGNTSISYTNEKGQTTATKQAGGGEELWVGFKYDLLGQLITVQNQKGDNTTYTYDMLGRKISTQHPDAGLITLDYDLADKLISSQNPLLKILNKKINYIYNFNQLIKVQYPDHDVKYEFGAPGAENYAAGRVVKQTDRTGTQTFKYSSLGQVVETGRTIVAPNVPPKYFKTSFVYDVYNRVNKITYPDQEEVTYNYNDVGLLKNMMSKPPTESVLQPIISDIVYDSRDQMTEITQGNGNKTTYQYDAWSRINSLSLSKQTQDIRSNSYIYDDNSNLKTLQSTVPLANNLPVDRMAIVTKKDFSYDPFNRLKSAAISASSLEETKYYALDMAYTLANNIANKNTKLKTFTNGVCSNPINEGEDATYNYEDATHPNAVSSISFAKGELFTTPLDCGKQRRLLLNPIQELYSYDADGNMTLIQEKTSGGKIGLPITTTKRQLFWDEQNRLKGIVENNALHHYIYDASGERILKSEGVAKDMQVNGDYGEAPSTTVSPYTYYPNGFVVLSDRNLSKHYYIGSQKVATRVTVVPSHGFIVSPSKELTDLSSKLKAEAEDIATQGGLPLIYWPQIGIVQGGGFGGLLEPIDPEEECDTNIRNQIVVFGAQSSCGIKLSNIYQTVINGDVTACDAWTAFLQDDCMKNFPAEASNSQVYWLHADELGSASILTNQAGNVTNWYEYLPFGEILMEQSSNDYNNPYLYNGKELDAATGLYYYGARYYDPRTSIFQSVDPLVEMTLQPYQYAYNNPVMFHDPTGMRGEMKGGWPPKDWWKKVTNWFNSLGGSDKETLIEEVKLYGKAKRKSLPQEDKGNFFSDFFNGPIQKPITGVNTVQVTKNTLITYRANQRGIYQFILPQDFGGWSQDDTASDGLIYKGCLSCHSDNGAYTYASHNSREAEIGRWGALAIQLVAINRLPKFRAAAKEVDVEGAVWAQKTFSGTFSAGGKFAGQTVDDVAGMLGSGTLSAADVPINVVVRNGQTFILNTRSSAALMRAGIPRSSWNVVNQTGVSSFESMLTGQLGRNSLINGTNTIRQSGTQLILSR